jgi:NAD(P)-dependent dehydrogenase (short-subunit alcohol dehydrogenase family)|tara:strand:- start:1298 stop:2173 length:876 start_codon:yes stop_codon:yes gene_type:complete
LLNTAPKFSSVYDHFLSNYKLGDKLSTIAITGSASGIGAATRTLLESDSVNVIGVDLHNAEIEADLSIESERSRAISEILRLSGGVLDGLVTSAGVSVPFDPARMLTINWFGTVDLLIGLREALSTSSEVAHVVAISSNSTTITPNVPDALVEACLRLDESAAHKILNEMDDLEAMAIAYAASKLSVARFVRQNAPTQDWAGSNIRLNSIAPGAVLTPLLQGGLDDPTFGAAIESLPIPVGGFASPELIAEWIRMMLSPSADFMCGSVLFLDGGSDALIRPNDWPVSIQLK